MLTFLLSLLSSSGFGSLVGLAGGVLNRLIDIKSKKVDTEFELAKMDKEHAYMKEEYEQKLQIATVEADAAVEVGGYNAMAKSYDFANTTTADGWVDKLSKTIRPILTLAFFIFTIYVFYQVQLLISFADAKPSPAEVLAIWKQCIDWIFFQAGVSIGWWFAMRPGKHPKA